MRCARRRTAGVGGEESGIRRSFGLDTCAPCDQHGGLRRGGSCHSGGRVDEVHGLYRLSFQGRLHGQAAASWRTAEITVQNSDELYERLKDSPFQGTRASDLDY